MTLGTFICKRVTYLCPFLTMCTALKENRGWLQGREGARLAEFGGSSDV